MKKILVLALVSAALVGSAFAQSTQKTPTTIACAVMPDNKVNIAAATKSKMFADYKGNRYFFCCGGCPAAFKADPAKYAKAAHIAAPKPTTK